MIRKLYDKMPEEIKQGWRKIKSKKIVKYANNLDAINTGYFLTSKFYFSEDFLHSNGYYSQFGQDLILDQWVFKNKAKGFFLDIGANDPIHLSNTYYFEKKGWTGLAFEPQPDLNGKWKEQRTTECLQIALGKENKTVEFVKVHGKENYMSGIRDVVSDEDYKSVGCDVINVQQRRLSDVLAERNIHQIDFASIDVEEYEIEVLDGIDFTQENISVFVIENNKKNTKEIRRYMRNKGYDFAGRWHIDDFYVKGYR